jgi:hypothetical protein
VLLGRDEVFVDYSEGYIAIELSVGSTYYMVGIAAYGKVAVFAYPTAGEAGGEYHRGY